MESVNNRITDLMTEVNGKEGELDENSIKHRGPEEWDGVCAARQAQRALAASLGHGVRLPQGAVGRAELLDEFLNRHGLAVAFGNEATLAQLVETAGIFYSAYPAEETEKEER